VEGGGWEEVVFIEVAGEADDEGVDLNLIRISEADVWFIHYNSREKPR